MPYEEIYTETLAAWMEGGKCHLIDVREEPEFAEAHIKGAILFPLSRFDPQSIIDSLPQDKKIVIQCRSGGRSAQACQILAAHAPDVTFYNLEGGILDWINAGLNTEGA